MATSTHIASITVKDLNVPLNEPFGISGGAQITANNILANVTLSNGTVGIGEGAPFSSYNGETQQIARDAVESVIDDLVGVDVNDWKSISFKLKERIPHSGSARCAL